MGCSANSCLNVFYMACWLPSRQLSSVTANTGIHSWRQSNTRSISQLLPQHVQGPAVMFMLTHNVKTMSTKVTFNGVVYPPHASQHTHTILDIECHAASLQMQSRNSALQELSTGHRPQRLGVVARKCDEARLTFTLGSMHWWARCGSTCLT